MKTLPLSAKPRTAAGKGGARRLRATGQVPAILYGEHTSPSSLSMNSHEFFTVLHKSSSEQILVDLTVEGRSATELALVKDVQHDPVSGDVIHVDFLHISPTSPIRVTVPVRVLGVADGVKNFGGILQHSSREVELEGLPVDLPDFVEVDVTNLAIHDAIHARDIKFDRVTMVTAADQTIVSVVPPTVLKEVTPTAEATPETAAGEPEVIGEKEREERREAAEKTGEGKEKGKAPEKEKGKDKGKDKG